MNADGKKILKKYLNIQKKINDLKIVMLKTALLDIFEKKYKWGSLIGVRPTKLIRKMYTNMDYTEIKEHLINLYMVDEEKANFLIDTAKNSEKYLNEKYINIYIGIPFCPTKCTYCSFASYIIEGKYLEIYKEFLKKIKNEIAVIGKNIKENNLKVESIYIGGGTPTILSFSELEELFECIEKNIEKKYIKEVTLEAGRIDTIDIDKLMLAKKYGINRISLNPQTFNEDTIKKINRYWDKNKFEEIYMNAKNMEFIINMDFIIGLPEETTEDILKTFEILNNYNPENLTVHVLALKKASHLYKKGHEISKIDYEKIQNKINEYIKQKNMKPYYMYRQKNSIEGGENIGYALKDKECIFNIEMIEENQDTIGIGGGAITKIFKNGELIRNINPKDPSVYVKEYDERIIKKIKLIKEIPSYN